MSVTTKRTRINNNNHDDHIILLLCFSHSIGTSDLYNNNNKCRKNIKHIENYIGNNNNIENISFDRNFEKKNLTIK